LCWSEDMPLPFGTNSHKWTIWAICSFLPPYNVYLTWLAMRLPYLLRGLRRCWSTKNQLKSSEG
jgi:hypothetical protein